MKELVGFAFNMLEFSEAKMKRGLEELTLRVGERKGQKAIVDTMRIDRNKWSPPLVVRCELSKRIGRPCTTHCGRRRRSWVVRKIAERTGLLWKLHENKGAGETYFDENLKGQVKTRTQEGKDLWEVWAASPADVLRICRSKVEGGANGSSTYLSLGRS